MTSVCYRRSQLLSRHSIHRKTKPFTFVATFFLIYLILYFIIFLHKTLSGNMMFEFLTAVKMSMLVSWVVAPCRLTEVYRRFRGTCCLHHSPENLKSYMVSLFFASQYKEKLINQEVAGISNVLAGPSLFNFLTALLTGSKSHGHVACPERAACWLLFTGLHVYVTVHRPVGRHPTKHTPP
jgi:hypothetical protein